MQVNKQVVDRDWTLYADLVSHIYSVQNKANPKIYFSSEKLAASCWLKETGEKSHPPPAMTESESALHTGFHNEEVMRWSDVVSGSIGFIICVPCTFSANNTGNPSRSLSKELNKIPVVGSQRINPNNIGGPPATLWGLVPLKLTCFGSETNVFC